jgi:hypothetical protein
VEREEGLIATSVCSAMTDWLLGMASGDGAALKPVPSGLSKKSSPKRRFQAKGLGDREPLAPEVTTRE